MEDLGKSWYNLAQRITNINYILVNPLRLNIRYFSRFSLEMNGVVEQKSFNWAKHAVRRWKVLYYEIQHTDGNLVGSSPLSFIFRNEAMAAKPSVSDSGEQTSSLEPTPSKKDLTPEPTAKPQKTPTTKSKEKQNKRRFFFKLKDLQIFRNPFTPF